MSLGPLGTHHEPLSRHALELGSAVEVELLVVEQIGAMGPTPMLRPRLVEGTVADATAAVLIIETRTGRLTRVPWPSVALIRDAAPVHPAL